MVRKGSSVRARWRASLDVPAQVGFSNRRSLGRPPPRGLVGRSWGACALGRAPTVAGRTRRGRDSPTCDISGEQLMPLDPNTRSMTWSPPPCSPRWKLHKRIRVMRGSVRRAAARRDLTASVPAGCGSCPATRRIGGDRGPCSRRHHHRRLRRPTVRRSWTRRELRGGVRRLPPGCRFARYAAAARSASATTCSMSRPSRSARSVRRSSVPRRREP